MARQAVKLAKAGRCGEASPLSSPGAGVGDGVAQAKARVNKAWNHALWHAYEHSRRLAVEVASRAGLKIARLCVG